MISTNEQITLRTKASAIGTSNEPCASTQKPFNRMRVSHAAAAQTAFSLAVSTNAPASAPTAPDLPAADGAIAAGLGGFLGTTSGAVFEYQWPSVQNSWAMKFLNGGAFSVVVETWLST